jgi:hypothetical protein
VCERHGIHAKASEESQIIFKNYLVEFQDKGERNSSWRALHKGEKQKKGRKE